LHLDLKKTLSVYQIFKGFEKQLIDEIGCPREKIGELLLYNHKPRKALWAKNIWENSQTISITSISDAARKLRALGKLWIPYYHNHIRRAKLIQEKLAAVPLKRLNFLEVIPTTTLGHWTLWNEHTILASLNCSSIRPGGDWEFHEDKSNPPSRAYLKLWELFTRLHFHPNNQEICLELGAAPGGWTWVLSLLCKKVITFDRAPLKEEIASRSNVDHHIDDAFSLVPGDYPEVDWIFSDVICTPEKLYNWLLPWLQDKKKRNFCLTIKLKGEDNQKWIEKFRAIPNGNMLHLYHNKHELTFVLIPEYP
jgi:23S rRNA (cytidine2498-2'-O)-methyltransferase